jgi:hypothetical protein
MFRRPTTHSPNRVWAIVCLSLVIVASVWTHANQVFKLRYTTRSIDTELEQALLSELLSEFGKACSSNAR